MVEKEYMETKPNNESRPRPRVLAVDDEPVNLTVIAGALFNENYELRLAESAGAARQILTDWLPDLVLLDVMMPGESGVELCTGLRRQPMMDAIPIVLVTALGASDHRTAGLAAGADDFIEKPIDIDELISRTASWVARGRPQAKPAPSRFPGACGDRILQAASELATGRRAAELANAMAVAIGERR